MTNTKLNFYFFGDIGEYDSFNPEYVCSKEYTSEILYLIEGFVASLGNIDGEGRYLRSLTMPQN